MPIAPAPEQCSPLPSCGTGATDLSSTQASLPALYVRAGCRKGIRDRLTMPLHPTTWSGGWGIDLDLIRCDFCLEDKGWKNRSDSESAGLWFNRTQCVRERIV